MGQQRAMASSRGNVYAWSRPVVAGQRKTSPGLVHGRIGGGFQKFIGPAENSAASFKNGLPWVLVFDGLPEPAGKRSR